MLRNKCSQQSLVIHQFRPVQWTGLRLLRLVRLMSKSLTFTCMQHSTHASLGFTITGIKLAHSQSSSLRQFPHVLPLFSKGFKTFQSINYPSENSTVDLFLRFRAIFHAIDEKNVFRTRRIDYANLDT